MRSRLLVSVALLLLASPALASPTARGADARDVTLSPTAPGPRLAAISDSTAQEPETRDATAQDSTPQDAAQTTDTSLRDGRGVWTHDRFRYGQRWNHPGGVLLRSLMDVVSIPSGVTGWTWFDWTVASAVLAAKVTLSLPFGPSLDVGFARGAQKSLGSPTQPVFWNLYSELFVWTGVAAGVTGMLLYGLVSDAPEYVEVAALAAEAFAVAQVYHLGLKLLTGREGPLDAVTPGQVTGEGRYLGPAGALSVFPAGTPSGHVVSLYAIASVVMHYFNTPAVWISLNAIALVFSVTLITDNMAFLSDVILGAALGFCVGRWVVHHRSTRYRNDADGLPARVWDAVQRRVALAPTVMPGGGMGAALVVRLD